MKRKRVFPRRKAAGKETPADHTIRNAQLNLKTVNRIKSVYPLDDYVLIVSKAAKEGTLTITKKQQAQEMLTKVGVQPAELSNVLALAKGTITHSAAEVKAESETSVAGVAEATAGLFSSEEGAADFLNRLLDESGYTETQKKTVLRKALELLEKIVERIKALLQDGVLSEVAADYATAQTEEAARLRQMFLDALDGMEIRESDASGAKFSLKHTENMTWKEQITAYYYHNGSIKTSDTLTLGETPNLLLKIGISDKPLAVPLHVISKAQSGKDYSHSLRNIEIRTLDEKIRNPMLVIDNVDRNSIVFVSMAKKGDVPVLISFEKDTVFDGDDVHKATSIHFQANVGSILEAVSSDSTVIIANKNELERMPGTPVRLGRLNTTAKLIDVSLPQTNSSVNTSDEKNANVQLSEEDAHYGENDRLRLSLGLEAQNRNLLNRNEEYKKIIREQDVEIRELQRTQRFFAFCPNDSFAFTNRQCFFAFALSFFRALCYNKISNHFTGGTFMRFSSFSALLGHYAAQTPHAPALQTEARGAVRIVDYAALQSAVKTRADALRAQAFTCLGILCDGSLSCVIEIFAAAEAGKQVVLLGEDADETRVRAADVDFLWGDEELTGALSGALTHGAQDGKGKLLFFTSGTTAKTKAVVLTEASLCASAWNGGTLLPLSPDDTLLCMLPLEHVFGFVCGLLWGLSCGACVALGRGARHYFDDCAFFRPTALSAVPLLLGFLLQKDLLGDSLRLVLVGAGDCSMQIFAALKAKGIRVCFGYGLTETSSGVALSLGDDPGAMTVCPDDTITLADDGEILIRSEACMMQGYYRDAAATATVLRDGVLHTGDLGAFDDRGLLHIRGRKKEILVLRDGTKIFLPEYERALLPVLDGRDFAVFARGGVPCLALYGSESERAAVTAALEPLMKEQPLGRRLQSIVFFSDPLPRTATGKIKRWALQQKEGIS